MAVVDGLQRLPCYAHRRGNRNPKNGIIEYLNVDYMIITLIQMIYENRI